MTILILLYDTCAALLKNCQECCSWRSLQNGLSKIIVLQLFLLLISLPFVVHWGLPVSWLCLVSTPLFLPILTLFLLISTMLFFAQLFELPTLLFARILDQVAALWIVLLRCTSHSLLFGFARPSWFVLIAILFCTILVMHAISMKGAHEQMYILFAFLCCVLCVLGIHQPGELEVRVAGSRKTSSMLLYDHGALAIIDNKSFNSGSPSWVRYQFLSEITTKTGALHIDHLVLPTITPRGIENVCLLADVTLIKNIYVPYIKSPEYTRIIGGLGTKNTVVHIVQGQQEIVMRKGSIVLRHTKKHSLYQGISYRTIEAVVGNRAKRRK
jgi:hypothetical protein